MGGGLSRVFSSAESGPVLNSDTEMDVDDD